MKQVIQNYKTGHLMVEEVPLPALKMGGLLVKTKASLISAGTERTKIETAQMNILEKALSRLDLVKIVVNNIKQEGLTFTLKKAFNKLDNPISLGYSCSGEVLEVGENVAGYKSGDRVVCVGEALATHAEVNFIPQEAAVKLAGKISYAHGSFAALGAISLNSIDIAQLQKSESVAVIGLGLIGQIIVQILRANGNAVLGIEVDEGKLSLAREFGLDACANPIKDDVLEIANNFTKGRGLDAVIVSAASKNNLPIEIAGKISRNKGRVVLVGTMPILLPRKEYYEKELHFLISRGCGCGLFFPIEETRKYPYGYRPYSIQENIQRFMGFVEEDKINLDPLITHCFSIEEAKNAYSLIRENKEKYLGIVFQYNNEISKEKKVAAFQIKERVYDKAEKKVNIGFIGAGSFAQGYILPVLKKIKGVNLIGVSTTKGITAKNVARKFSFDYAATNYQEILNDDKINCVFILTRHNLHAKFVSEALEKNKHIFVEKPLCVTEAELKKIVNIYNNKYTISNKQLMVGFNRRFSPFIKEAKGFFANTQAPLVINYRINAGSLPFNHWVHSHEGCGRIIGEVCHFVDLLNYITGSLPKEVSTISLKTPDQNIPFEDNVLINIKFFNGSIASINYNSVGDLAFPRERIEIFGAKSVVTIDNFNKAKLSRNGRVKKITTLSRDMGHKYEINSFIDSLLDRNSSLVPFDELLAATLTTFKIRDSLETNKKIEVGLEHWLEKKNG